MQESRRRARVYIAYTGGTIGMRQTPSGYRPAPGHLERLMALDPRFQSPLLPEYEVRQYNPLLDSADMTPADWLALAQDIQAHYLDYDGFLVVHGTDTMAYTASALSFMLEGLAKPVILTGAQVPMEELRSDAQDNLLGALLILGAHHRVMSEVFVYFDNKLFRGNRVTKIDAEQFDAFASPNFPVVASNGITLSLNTALLRQPRPEERTEPPVAVPIGEASVVVCRLFPGLKVEHIRPLLQAPVEGVVLECFGSGNAPDRNLKLMEALHEATEQGVVVVAVRQPLHGSADLSLYATGRSLLEAGVVAGQELTTEAALTKLFYLFATGASPAEVRLQMAQNLRGEL